MNFWPILLPEVEPTRAVTSVPTDREKRREPEQYFNNFLSRTP